MKRIDVGLALAVAAVLAGSPSSNAQDRPAAAVDAAAPVTFNKDIAPLVFRNCVTCHRPGEVAPFSLLTYADAKKRAKQIQAVTSRRFMPPWKSVAGHGSFVGERRLSEDEIGLIARWVEQGAAEGIAQDLPAAPRFPEGWRLGEPDLVVTMPEAYDVPADGPDIYRDFVFKLDIPEGKYIQAAEYRPANRRVVHHALLAMDATDRSRKKDEADPKPGYGDGLNIPGQMFPGSMGSWTPGRDALRLPEGLSMPWKKGADFVLQLHLHPSGKPEVERSRVGFFLTDQPPRRSMADVFLIDTRIDIPPGERSYRSRDELTLPIDVEALGVFPHMHLIGRDMKITAYPPAGDPFSMLRIDDWDFSWQGFYQYARPMKLAAGTRIVLEATHDNSADNARNPRQPPGRVTWGEQTTDEMTVAILQLVPVREADFPKLNASFRRRILGKITASVAKLELPRTASDLFRTTKVWSLHLRFSPEQWAAMEPPARNNFFDPSEFGMGMFLIPVVMRDGERDGKAGLSAEEFRGLGERWFAAWDGDGDGVLDAKQLRAGLKTAMAPPKPADGKAASGGKDKPPAGFSLQGPKGKRNGLSSVMGTEFAHVHADLEFEGQRFGDVAVRYKGNGTFLEARGSLKRSFKVDLNKYVKGQELAGVTTLNLHNNVTDAGLMNEVLSYWFYRDAKVPAPRTAYARVFVTVPGKHDRQYFGLYSLVENVGKAFVADRDLAQEGALLKPSSPDLFADLGDDWEAYDQTFDPKNELAPAQKRRVVDFCKLVANAKDAEFAARIGDYVDLDEFARFLAVSVWIADLDSLLTSGQNFYLYLDPRTNRFLFIPWDKDHTFGTMGGRVQADRDELSIREPWDGRKHFLERIFQVEAFRAAYLARMAEFQEGPFRAERFEERVAEIGAAIRPAVQEESAAKLTRFDAVVAGKPLPGVGFGFGSSTQTILPFSKARSRSVADQLAGKSEGRMIGKVRPGDPPMPEFRPEEMVEPALSKALDADKDKKLTRDEFVGGFAKWFGDWDAAKAGNLSEDQVRKALNKALPFGPPPPPPKPDAPKP